MSKVDTLDFMEDNGSKFFLTTDDKVTPNELLNIITQLKEVNDNIERYSFEDLETEIIEEFSDSVKMLIAEYEKDLAVWQEAQGEETKEWKADNPKKGKKSKKREKNVFKGLTF